LLVFGGWKKQSLNGGGTNHVIYYGRKLNSITLNKENDGWLKLQFRLFNLEVNSSGNIIDK